MVAPKPLRVSERQFLTPNSRTMEVLYYVIFGSLLALFIGYAIWMHHKDKKILKEWEEHEKKRQSEISYKADGRVLGWRDIPGEEMDFLYSERPFVDCYKSAN